MAKYVVYHADPLEVLGDAPIERAALAEIDAELRMLEPGMSPGELAEALPEADAVLVTRAPINATVMAALRNCKVVVRYGVGVDTLDLEAATEHGIVCAHVPDFCMEEVANHALMHMLAAVRKLIPQDRAVREGGWRDGLTLQPMLQLYGQTVGLVACGNIGQAFAKRAQALSMRVIAYDPYIDPSVPAALGIELIESLEDLLRQSDVVSLHTPATPETRQMINAERLSQMKPTAYLVNTARGSIVDQPALIDALERGVIAGAGLDVFEEEPWVSDSPLRTMDNVVHTPHSASYSDASYERLSTRVGQSVVHVLTGHWPRFVANKGILEQLDLAECPDPA